MTSKLLEIALPHAPGKEVVNGESVPYLGRDYPIEIAETKSGGIEFSRRFLIPAAQQAKRRKVLKDWYVSRATETILTRVKRHASELVLQLSTCEMPEAFPAAHAESSTHHPKWAVSQPSMASMMAG